MSAPMPFEEIEHTADVAIHVKGRDLEDLFRNAAIGMNSLMAATDRLHAPPVGISLALDGGDAEDLLVDWLSELAYLAESRRLIFHHFDFRTLSSRRLEVELRGNMVDGIQKHIKAVTYHNLKIEKTKSGFETTVVFDV